MGWVLDFVGQAFSFESVSISLVHTALFTLVTWLLARVGAFPIWKKASFWVVVFVGTFVVLGVLGRRSVATPEPEAAKFALEIPAVRVIGPGASEATSTIILTTGITSRGSPSIVTNWRVYVREPGRDEVECRVIGSSQLVVQGDSLRYEDLIYQQTRDNRLLQGERIVADLPCVVPITFSRATRGEVVYRVVAGDVYGNDYEAERCFNPEACDSDSEGESG